MIPKSLELDIHKLILEMETAIYHESGYTLSLAEKTMDSFKWPSVILEDIEPPKEVEPFSEESL